MQEMMSNNFQGSFNAANNRSKNANNSNKAGGGAGSGVRADPKFAQATNKAQQISNIEQNMMQLNIQRDKLKDELSKMPEHAKKAA